MLTADSAFQHTANAAALYAATTPAYVSYSVDSHITIPSMHRERDISVREITRTADGKTIVFDLPHGRVHTEDNPFPFAPSLDAVSYFHLAYAMSLRGTASFNISDVIPMTFSNEALQQGNDVDVVVTSTRAYHVRFAADSSDTPTGVTHLILRPHSSTRANAPRSSFFFSDIKIDNASGLPSEVTFTGTDDLVMTVDYGPTAHRWSATHAQFEQTVHGPLRVGRVHFIATAVFHDVTYGAAKPPEAGTSL